MPVDAGCRFRRRRAESDARYASGEGFRRRERDDEKVNQRGPAMQRPCVFAEDEDAVFRERFEEASGKLWM